MRDFLKKYWIFLSLGLGFLAVIALTFFFLTPRESDSAKTSPKSSKTRVFYEEIPGSRNHSPDGTWWGYNMSKIVRFGDTVYIYVVHNDDDPATPSKFTIYKKEGDKGWEKGADFPTSRPGNILIDSTGVLHAFVFEATDTIKNDSVGRLMHYWFPASAKGDITSYKEETVVGAKSDTETVNIRVGAAVGAGDTLAVGFGLPDFSKGNNNQTEQLYYKRKTDKKWTREIAGENLGHDFYYPFVLVSKKGFHFLPVQDDFVAPNKQNIYQKIMYFEKTSSVWRKDLVADLSGHNLAKSRPSLLAQTDLYEDMKGEIHVVYKEFLDPIQEDKVSSFKHLVQKEDGWNTETIDFGSERVDWVRLIEVNGNLYFIAQSGSVVVIKRSGSRDIFKVKLPPETAGAWMYLAVPRGGISPNEKYIDILMLNANQNDYPNAANYYVRIPKSELYQTP